MTAASPRHRAPEPRVDAAPPADAEATTLVFDRAAARAVDHAAINEFGIPGMVLMENAARGLAMVAQQMIADRSGPVLIVCGNGNNGGEGYALARHLHNHGVAVALAPLGNPPSGSDADINLRICRNMKLPVVEIHQLDQWMTANRPSLIVDAIFGTGLDRPVTGQAADIIEWINAQQIPVLAADVPSGLDCDTGRALGICVKSTRTVTFIGIKKGFLGLDAQKLLGEVTVADIGAPREVLERFGTRVAIRRPNSPERPINPTADKSAR